MRGMQQSRGFCSKADKGSLPGMREIVGFLSFEKLA